MFYTEKRERRTSRGRVNFNTFFRGKHVYASKIPPYRLSSTYIAIIVIRKGKGGVSVRAGVAIAVDIHQSSARIRRTDPPSYQ